MFLDADEIDPIPVFDPMSVGAMSRPACCEAAGSTPPPFTDVVDEWSAEETPHTDAHDGMLVGASRLETVRPFAATRAA